MTYLLNMANAGNNIESCPYFDQVVFNIGNSSTPQFVNCFFNIPTSIAAILGNLSVLISIWRTPSLHLPLSVLIFGLALCNLGIGLVVQPLFVLFSVAKIMGWMNIACTSGVTLLISSYYLCGVSLLIHTAISVDRFVALHLHLGYQEVVTTKRAIFFVAGIWLASTFPGISALLWDHNTHNLVFLIISSLCVSVTYLLYLRMEDVVQSRQCQVQDEAQSQEQNITSLDMAEYMKHFLPAHFTKNLFLSFYAPYFAAIIWLQITDYTLSVQCTLEFTATIFYINSCLYPLVYIWFLSEFRFVVLKAMHKCLFKSTITAIELPP